MDNLVLYCHESSELAEFDALSRGYRQIFVSKGNQVYLVHIYDFIRIKQDFDTELDSNGFYGIEPNIILVSQVTTKNIVFTVENLNRQRFFEALKPIKIDILKLEKLLTSS